MNWIYLILPGVGFLPLMVVLYRMNQLKQWRKNAIAVKATIVKTPFGYHPRMTRITIQYYAKESGRIIEKQIAVAGNPYSVGQQLSILYKKENPHQSIVDPDKSFAGMLIFGIIIVFVFIAATLFIHESVATGQM